MRVFDNIVLKEIKSVVVLPTKKGRFIEIKERDSYALSFCIGEGRIVYDHNGKTFVSDKNRAVIIPKGATYNLRNEEGGDFPVINFFASEDFTDEFISIPLTAPESYIDDFYKIERLYSSGSASIKLFSAFYSMICRMWREVESKHSILSPAMEYMAKHISDPELSNLSLAKICNVSEVYFRKTFKKKYGISPKQYILNMRITRAKELLSEGMCAVGRVAELCGFSSVYHFSRSFRAITGSVPSDYKSK